MSHLFWRTCGRHIWLPVALVMPAVFGAKLAGAVIA